MGTPSISTLGRMALSVGTPAATTVAEFAGGGGDGYEFEYMSENLRMVQSHIGGPGIRGTRSRVEDKVRVASEAISGTIVLQPTPLELDILFPLILMGVESPTDTFSLGEVDDKFAVLVDRGANRFIYNNCKVNKATFSCSEGSPMTLSLDIEGGVETVVSTAFAVNTAAQTDQPYVFRECTFSLPADASATEVKSFSISIDNALDAGRFMNSLTRASIPATDRIVSVQMSVPYTADETALHDIAIAGMDGAWIKMTNSGVSTLFTFGNLKAPANSPVTNSRGSEVMLDLNMTAYQATDGTKELVITHDATA